MADGQELAVRAAEEKLAVGKQMVRVITNRDVQPMIERLNARGYGVTCVDGAGATGPVRMVYTIIRRKDLPEVQAWLEAARLAHRRQEARQEPGPLGAA